MCIRDSVQVEEESAIEEGAEDVGCGSAVPLIAMRNEQVKPCLLYTSDAADDLLCVDLGGRRIIKKKKNMLYHSRH